ncbi:MAG: hypothetical protein LIP10_03650 [Clostridiales bacterium]|nr:hypothetical protein [Clostridiales bacterium]
MAKSGRYPWNNETSWQKIRPTVAGVLTAVSMYLMFSMGWDKGQEHFADVMTDAYHKKMESEDQGNSKK